jgi:hypothetical protein
MTTVTHACIVAVVFVMSLALVACGPAATVAPTAGPTAQPTQGPIIIDGPAEVAAGGAVAVAWSGSPTRGDYLTIVAKAATRTNNEPYVDVAVGTPQVNLTAPATAGEYEIWFVEGDTVDKVKARLPLKVT